MGSWIACFYRNKSFPFLPSASAPGDVLSPPTLRSVLHVVPAPSKPSTPFYVKVLNLSFIVQIIIIPFSFALNAFYVLIRSSNSRSSIYRQVKRCYNIINSFLLIVGSFQRLLHVFTALKLKVDVDAPLLLLHAPRKPSSYELNSQKSLLSFTVQLILNVFSSLLLISSVFAFLTFVCFPRDSLSC